MKRKQLFFSLLICLCASVKGFAQFALVCNDLVNITLDPDCSHTVLKEEILEGSFCATCDYVVEIDKTPPFGNGPWVPAVVTSADLGKTYQVRVKELSTGNICWGNLKVVEQLECTGVTTLNLSGGAPTILTPADLQINFVGNCITINAATTTMNNGQPSVTYDCSDLGVHILQVTASDGALSVAQSIAVTVTQPRNGVMPRWNGRLDPATGNLRVVALGQNSAPHGVVRGPDGVARSGRCLGGAGGGGVAARLA